MDPNSLNAIKGAAGAGGGGYSGDLAVAHSSVAPTFLAITVYPWTSGTGFGTKYADPSSLPGNSNMAVTFSPDGADIVVGDFSTSPYIFGYPWTSGSGFGTKYADPSTTPTNGGKKVAFSPAA